MKGGKLFLNKSLNYVINLNGYTYMYKLITISQYLPLTKHSNVTPDVVPFIATWLVGPRMIHGVEGIEPGFRTAK